MCAQSLQEQLEAVLPVTEDADKLLSECQQLTAADTAAAAAGAVERCRYDTLMHRYHEVVANVSKLVAMTTESIDKRDTLSVSC